MKRRQFITYTGASFLATTLGLSKLKSVNAQATPLTIQYLGHTSFLFTGNGMRILVNPFRSIGCTAGYKPPKVAADLVLISSQLLDEGDVDNLPGNPKILYEPGVYQINGIQFQGIGMPHDREGGRRFGTNVAWSWNQSGIKVLHLGGAAAPIDIEERILMGRPDVALIPVGGGVKAYNPKEAKQAIQSLNPRVVIPTQYRTEAANPQECDIVGVDEFLKLSEGMSIQRINHDRIAIRPSDLPQEGTVIRVLSHRNALSTSS
jgi:L-ascorbate metabolism protein UlaG (beta-lactamase superfamily)